MKHGIAMILIGFSIIMLSMSNMSQDEKIEALSTRLEVLEVKNESPIN